MARFRSCLAVVIALSLACIDIPEATAARAPVGILTLATHAHLDDATAYPGLSVFEGERLSTEAEGRVGLRTGDSVLTLGGRTEVELVPLGGGLHVDLDAGSVHFYSAAEAMVEVHAGDALVQPAKAQRTRGIVSILGRKVLQITADEGNLNFSYHEEFRALPMGQTYRIYLDGSDDVSQGRGPGGQTAQGRSSVAYYILGAGAAGAGAWGIYEALREGNLPISPAKP